MEREVSSENAVEARYILELLELIDTIMARRRARPVFVYAQPPCPPATAHPPQASQQAKLCWH